MHDAIDVVVQLLGGERLQMEGWGNTILGSGCEEG